MTNEILDFEEIEYQAWLEKRREQCRAVLDQFAGLAMQGMIASGEYDLTDSELATAAYKKAAAMFRERDGWAETFYPDE
jgi:uncharacterized protein YecT (DUF1311 family)